MPRSISLVTPLLLSSLWVSRTGSASDWCALQEALYKFIDTIQYNTSLNTVRPRQQKVDALLNFPTPTNRKQVQSLLGLAGYYGKFLPHYTHITLPLTKLFKKHP